MRRTRDTGDYSAGRQLIGTIDCVKPQTREPQRRVFVNGDGEPEHYLLL
jgi:hypothetical protein